MKLHEARATELEAFLQGLSVPYTYEQYERKIYKEEDIPFKWVLDSFIMMDCFPEDQPVFAITCYEDGRIGIHREWLDSEDECQVEDRVFDSVQAAVDWLKFRNNCPWEGK